MEQCGGVSSPRETFQFVKLVISDHHRTEAHKTKTTERDIHDRGLPWPGFARTSFKTVMPDIRGVAQGQGGCKRPPASNPSRNT